MVNQQKQVHKKLHRAVVAYICTVLSSGNFTSPHVSPTCTTHVPRADHACGHILRAIKRVMVRRKAISCSKLSTMADTQLVCK